MKDVRGDFPLLGKMPGLVYLDSACTSLKPLKVIEAEMAYYTELGACGGRSSHAQGRRTSEIIDESREKVASFVKAGGEELVWTRNATEALNIVANALDYSKRRKVVTSVIEHHSVLLPFMRLRDEGKITLEIVDSDDEGKVSPGRFAEAIGRDTALVVTHSWDNTTGCGRDVRGISKAAHDSGALVCVDGAQGVPHHRTDSRDADFLCFSGHKMLGPTGIGALVARKDLLRTMKPLMSGGGTVKTVSLDRIGPLENQERFEAGVQHYSGMVGFAAACDYLRGIGMEEVESHEKALAGRMLKAIRDSGARICGPATDRDHGALYSFNFKAKPHDVALMLDKAGIALRSGFFCAQPAMERLGAPGGAARASAYIYNDEEDIRKFGEELQRISALYS